jgi:hypothetical protein
LNNINQEISLYRDLSINNILIKKDKIYFIDLEIHNKEEIYNIGPIKRDLVHFVKSFKRNEIIKKYITYFRDCNLLEASFLKGYENESGIKIDMEDYFKEKIIYYNQHKGNNLLRKIIDCIERKRIEKLLENFDYRIKFIEQKKVKKYHDKFDDNSNFYKLIWDEYEKKILLKEIKKIKIRNKSLDFACGSGRIITETEQFFIKPFGVDVSQEMLKIAKNSVKKAKIIKIDITTEKINNKFNCITAYRFFLNANNTLRYEVMFRIADYLTDEGKLIFNIHGMKYSFAYYINLIRRLIINSEERYISHNEIIKILSFSGLKVKCWYVYGVLPSFMRKLLGNKIYILLDKFLCIIFFNKLTMFRTYVVKKAW